MTHSWCLGLVCLLVCVLPSVFSKDCYYCDVSPTTKCPSIKMSCEEDQDCYVGEGVALGVPMVHNKGCTRAINCGKEQPVTYRGITYSLVTICCNGQLCNTAEAIAKPSLFLLLAFTIMLLLGFI
ncbi:sperm acrosome membrane-associated protein 4 [Anolis carolinensis]|uniref:sperm acrosome membrane-associated protein 4 n=1 Tax=Anolis carolinensis TaxID=28377 RepID=UPI000462A82E|nr:PREDICTED: sperm acrosome membrane-associated protein 4 [Anolis carolinensis]|eukprot:XP_008115456.1 PREDICTED: sperm acrosome membrane-associated protein 4 [Anolis carolinensis]